MTKINFVGSQYQQTTAEMVGLCYANATGSRQRVVHPQTLTLSLNTVEPGYNDIGLCDISSITSDILWYQLITHC
jgi:hypothetical protein